MAAQPVEWVLVVYYGTAAHQSTYGRQVARGGYSKDYIQLHRNSEFLESFHRAYPATVDRTRVELTYRWPGGTTPGALNFSVDRWHLKWETRLDAPPPWRMSREPSEATVETIPGDPSHQDFDLAENELAQLATRGAGQPYLMAIKLRDEPSTLHLRAYLAKPSKKFAWADIQLAPPDIRALAARTGPRKALASSSFVSGGAMPSAEVERVLPRFITSESPTSEIDALDADTGRALANYLRDPGYGLFFDPTRNHDAWLQPAPLPEHVSGSVDELVRLLDARFPPIPQGDAAAERLEADPEEVEAFRNKIKRKSFEVLDSTATQKTRGSAQKAFADEVKANYGCKCAITGIETKDFLVGAHIVPWSKDQTIRLDPSNGICLSLLVDRAFEKGYLLIEDDHTIRIDWGRVGDDNALRSQLEPYDGQGLNAPAMGGPKLEYLQRRRVLAVPTE
jgi:hypothetical protein